MWNHKTFLNVWFSLILQGLAREKFNQLLSFYGAGDDDISNYETYVILRYEPLCSKR